MKALLATTGPFQLVDPHGGQRVGPNRPYVVHFSGFYGQRHALGQLKIICGSLHDSATDEAFAGYIKESEGDMELAIASFLAAFDVDQPGVKEKLDAESPPVSTDPVLDEFAATIAAAPARPAKKAR